MWTTRHWTLDEKFAFTLDRNDHKLISVCIVCRSQNHDECVHFFLCLLNSNSRFQCIDMEHLLLHWI